MRNDNEANQAVVDPEADKKYIQELSYRLDELQAEKDKEYFARLTAELEARKYKDAFQALVKEIANLHQ